MQNLGSYELGETIDFTFVTAGTDGAPATLSGTPAISAYVGNSTTQITAGITLTADFDSVTGLNHVRAVLTSGNGYADDTDVSFVITTGTVGGTSVVGYTVGRVDIGRHSAYLRLGAPAGASVSADIGAMNDLDAAGVRAALGLAAANLDTQLDALPTAAENRAEMDSNSTQLAAIVADTNELQTDDIPGLIAALNNISTAQVNAEVADVLKTDTTGDPSQGAPPLNATIQAMINYLYREYVRNKVVVDTDTANQKQVFADDGSTILYEKDLTDSGSILTVAESTTGA